MGGVYKVTRKVNLDAVCKQISDTSSSNNIPPANHQRMMNMLSDAFHETHLTLAQLALQSPVTSNSGHDPKPPSCPLVGEAGGGWDGEVMDKARDMLQPFMSHLSRELSDELVKVVRDRLDGAKPPR